MNLGYLRWAAYGLSVGAAIFVALSIRQLIRERRAPYYILRRAARRQAKRLILVALVVQGLAVIVLISLPRPAASIQVSPTPSPSATPSPATPTSTPTVTPKPASPTPRPTHTPTRTPTRTPTPRPTATPLPSATPTRDVPVPVAALTPLPSQVPAGQEARIELVALATEKDENDAPVNPGDVLPPGDHWVYLFFTYTGMENGVMRSFAWYRDGEFVERCSDTALWEWSEAGSTWYGCRPAEGWEQGGYEVRVFVETRLQFVARFRVVADG